MGIWFGNEYQIQQTTKSHRTQIENTNDILEIVTSKTQKKNKTKQYKIFQNDIVQIVSHQLVLYMLVWYESSSSLGSAPLLDNIFDLLYKQWSHPSKLITLIADFARTSTLNYLPNLLLGRILLQRLFLIKIPTWLQRQATSHKNNLQPLLFIQFLPLHIIHSCCAGLLSSIHHILHTVLAFFPTTITVIDELVYYTIMTWCVLGYLQQNKAQSWSRLQQVKSSLTNNFSPNKKKTCCIILVQSSRLIDSSTNLDMKTISKTSPRRWLR